MAPSRPPRLSEPAEPSERVGEPSGRHRARRFLQDRFAIDTRALAAFRISLGLVVIGDLLFRARDIRAFYTDSGVLPRSALAELFPALSVVSLHTVSGDVWMQALLFVVAGVFAVGLAVGYRTRLMTVAVFTLHASLYARNPYVLNGGDGLLVVALLVAVFLPLGERWSVDAVGAGDHRKRVTSLATVTILAQLVVIYVANVPFKLRSEAWMRGDGTRHALELEQFAVYLGPYLAEFPALLVAVNWLWIGLMALSPLLILAGGRLRTVVVAGFIAAHLGMLATLRLGFFPLIVTALLLLYLPSPVWSGLESRSEALRRSLADRAPTRRRDTPMVPAPLRRAGRVLGIVVLVFVLIGSVVWPVTALGVAEDTRLESTVETDYTWTLFAPNPPTETRWFVASATFESGEEIDAFRGGPVKWEKPPDAADAYPTALWHRYLNELRFASDAERQHLAAYLCRQATEYGGESPAELRIYAVEETIDAAGGGDAEHVELYRSDCEAPT